VQRITEMLRRPETILDASRPEDVDADDWGQALGRLLKDIRDALMCDPGNCPEADVTRREMGETASLRDSLSKWAGDG
jgi:hypothetical protein